MSKSGINADVRRGAVRLTSWFLAVALMVACAQLAAPPQRAAAVNGKTQRETIYHADQESVISDFEYKPITVEVNSDFPGIAVSLEGGTGRSFADNVWAQLEKIRATPEGQIQLLSVRDAHPIYRPGVLPPGDEGAMFHRQILPDQYRPADITLVFAQNKFSATPEIGSRYTPLAPDRAIGGLGTCGFIYLDESLSVVPRGLFGKPDLQLTDDSIVHESLHGIKAGLGVVANEQLVHAVPVAGPSGVRSGRLYEVLTDKVEEILTTGLPDNGTTFYKSGGGWELLDRGDNPATRAFRKVVQMAEHADLDYVGANSLSDGHALRRNALRDVIKDKSENLYVKQFNRPMRTSHITPLKSETVGVEPVFSALVGEFLFDDFSAVPSNFLEFSTDAYADVPVQSLSQADLDAAAAKYYEEGVTPAELKAGSSGEGRRKSSTDEEESLCGSARVSPSGSCTRSKNTQFLDEETSNRLEMQLIKNRADILSVCTACQKQFADRYEGWQEPKAKEADRLLEQALRQPTDSEADRNRISELLDKRQSVLSDLMDGAVGELKGAGVKFTQESENALRLRMGLKVEGKIETLGETSLIEPQQAKEVDSLVKKIQNDPAAMKEIGLNPGEKMEPGDPRLKNAAPKVANRIFRAAGVAGNATVFGLMCVAAVGQATETFGDKESDALDKAQSALGCVPVAADALNIAQFARHGQWDDAVLASISLILFLASFTPCGAWCAAAAMFVQAVQLIWDAAKDAAEACGLPPDPIGNLFAPTEKRICFLQKWGENIKQAFEALGNSILQGLIAIGQTKQAEADCWDRSARDGILIICGMPG
ncbi:hypothetical protein ACFCYM_33245 [Streptomyces sp. NPDC056254]|uniref:hypothetical protein n=1 Tax=Streptomyces sp. NPDC056254 TaxID=3345763 RepID=UPI0035D5FA96